MSRIKTSAKLGKGRSSATTQDKLHLTSGEKVKTKRRRHSPIPPPPLPPPPPLTIGKLASLEMTLQRYGITPDAFTAKRLNGGVR